ncbi:hypothetical protein Droror1_Dr00015069 [Drosera rotundifolia]
MTSSTKSEAVLGPAIVGTKHVLTAAKKVGVECVVGTSSISAIMPSQYWPADVFKREDCWTDVEYCKQKRGFVDICLDGIRKVIQHVKSYPYICIQFKISRSWSPKTRRL